MKILEVLRSSPLFHHVALDAVQSFESDVNLKQMPLLRSGGGRSEFYV